MRDRVTFLSLALILAASLLGCGDGANSTANVSNVDRSVDNSNVAQSNVEELDMLVNVRYDTEDIVWKHGADKKRVIAVMRFSPVDADKIVTAAKGYGGISEVSLASETWFPAELIAQSDASGDNTLKGTALPANDFFLEPYTSGRITRIEGTDYFILDLTAH